MLGSLANKLDTLGASWARKRQGADASSGTTLGHRRIYILPTRHGIAFGLVVFAMLLGSINYNSSLGYALTFLLAGLALVIMHHCHNNLLLIRLRFVGAHPVFAGELATFKIAATNDASVARNEVEIGLDKRNTQTCNLESGQTEVIGVAMPSARRGWLRLDRFAVTTQYPGNLFRAWSWLHMNTRCLIYPEPAPPGRAIPDLDNGQSTGNRIDPSGADFFGLRAAISSDSPKHIAWKAYARNEELLVKQFSASDRHTIILDWDSLRGIDNEHRISQLTRWCLDAAERSMTYGLRLPGRTIEPSSGRDHLHECLQALALFEAPR